jgi:hypothetical protein
VVLPIVDRWTKNHAVGERIAAAEVSRPMEEACRRRPGNLPSSKCSSSSSRSMEKPFGSSIRRTSHDWLRSSHAAWIAESRDRAARDTTRPSRSAKTTCHIIGVGSIRCCANRCTSQPVRIKLRHVTSRRTIHSVALQTQCISSAIRGKEVLGITRLRF